MGGTVFWADKDLCCSDEYHFGYSELSGLTCRTYIERRIRNYDKDRNRLQFDIPRDMHL